MTLPINATLQGGKYFIKKVLGQGGFGITYLAEHTLLGADVAIKEFFMKDLNNRDEETSQVSVGSNGSRDLVTRFKAKFLKEARNIYRLNHPNIVRIQDIFEENGTAYYVMEYCDGGSLLDQLKQHPNGLTESQALTYIKQVASAVEYIHEQKMNHLDIKPGNIVLNSKGEAVLIDFGLSKQYDAETGEQTSTTPMAISHGYAPIEQYTGVTEFSPQTDIYSLGATLYKLLTGITPVRAGKKQKTLPTTISTSTREAIDRSMQIMPANRFQTISEFLTALDNTELISNDNQSNVEKVLNKSPQIRSGENEGFPIINNVEQTADTEDTHIIEESKEVSNSPETGLDDAKKNNKAIKPNNKIKKKKKKNNNRFTFHDSFLISIAFIVFIGLIVYSVNKWGKASTKQNNEITSNGNGPLFGNINGHDWVDLGLPSGTKWATCNIGAANPSDVGDYFAWGEIFPKKEYLEFNYEYKSDNTILDSKQDAATVNWGEKWDIPSKEDFDELLELCTWIPDKTGYKILGTNGNSIYLPCGGFKAADDAFTGSFGIYWSNSLNMKNENTAWTLYFHNDSQKIKPHVSKFYRYYGRNIRPVSHNK